MAVGFNGVEKGHKPLHYTAATLLRPRSARAKQRVIYLITFPGEISVGLIVRSGIVRNSVPLYLSKVDGVRGWGGAIAKSSNELSDFRKNLVPLPSFARAKLTRYEINSLEVTTVHESFHDAPKIPQESSFETALRRFFWHTSLPNAVPSKSGTLVYVCMYVY